MHPLKTHAFSNKTELFGEALKLKEIPNDDWLVAASDTLGK